MARRLVGLLILLTLGVPILAARADSLAGIMVISDFHLHHGVADDVNRITFDQVMKVLSQNGSITDVIVNGDVLDGPSVMGLSNAERIRETVSILLEIKKSTSARVRFNFGNHDEKLDEPGFSQELKLAVETAGIQVIGTDPKAVYDLNLGGLKLRISHFPFVKTQFTSAQSKRFSNELLMYQLVNNNLPLLIEADGIIRIMSHSHSPLIDKRLGVVNTGSLSTDISGEPNTMLHIDSTGHFELYTVRADGEPEKYSPNCGGYLAN
jgi:predicted phosphodiesterase